MSFAAILTFCINLRVLLDERANSKRKPLELQKYFRNLHKIIQKR